MDMAIFLLLAVIALLLVLVAALAMWRKSDRPAQLAKLTAINATLQSNLDNTQKQMTRMQDQLEPFGRLRDECTGLKESLAAARDLNLRIEREKTTWKERSEQLQQQLQELMAKKSEIQTKLDNKQQQLHEHNALEERFKDAFRALSADTLKTQSENFHKQNENLQNNASAELKARQEAIEKLLQPLSHKIDILDRARVDNAAMFREQIDKMIRQGNELGQTTHMLANALQKPSVRGRWGEIQLERVLEMSGLSKDIDYSVQHSFDTEKQRLRPDVIVNMPEDRRVILDSKVSLAALLDAFETDDEEEKTQALNRHVEQIKTHVKDLSSKEYWSLLPTTADFVVMVVPEFAFLSAIERDNSLTEWALNKKVIIVTPPTLLALLKGIALTFKQMRVVKKAHEISELGKELHDRLAIFAEHYIAMGKALHSAVERYNKATNSWDSRVMSAARRFQKLEVPVTKQQPELQNIDSVPTMINKVPDSESEAS